MGDIKKMLNPKTIALLGASEKEGSVGRTILENLLLSPERQIFAVNPNRKKALAFECFPSIADIQEHIDLAVIATPASSLPGLLEECGKSKAEGIIIVSAGLEKRGEEWKALKDQITAIREKHGMRIIGPGSPGIIIPYTGLNASLLGTNPLPGNTAFISQSGAIGSAILDWGIANHIGFSFFAGLGSMIDVDFADLIDFLQEDYFTRSIMLYLENVRNAKKFISAARSFARNKPIVVLKPGRFPVSGSALPSYMGAETGDDRVYDAAFRRTGLVRVKEIADLFDTTKVLVSKSIPRGPRLAIVTNSGGIGIISSDALSELKGELAKLSPESIMELDNILPQHWKKGNPVDILGDADIGRYAKTIGICLKDDGVDGVLVAYTYLANAKPDELAQTVVEILKKTGKPVIATWMGGKYAREGIELLEQNNIPAYETPEKAVKAYMYMYNYSRNIEFLNETPEELPIEQKNLKNHLKAIVHNAIKEGSGLLGKDVTMGFLKNYGITAVLAGMIENMPDNINPEWYLRLKKDVEFGSVIFFCQYQRHKKGLIKYSVGLPPLNQTLAKKLLEESEINEYLQDNPENNEIVLRSLEKIIVSFSNLIIDFPEIADMEIGPIVISNDIASVLSASITIDKDYVIHDASRYPHLVIMPYPARYSFPWKLNDGTEVAIRPIRAEDEPLAREMLSTLSEETLRVRFFVVMEITHRMVMQFCNIDYDREIAFVAELKEGEKKRIIGGGRLIIESDFKSGQFALLIQDDFHGKGLGEKFLDILIGIAQERELEKIYGVILTENEKMLRVCRKFGFKPTKLPDGITRVTLELK